MTKETNEAFLSVDWDFRDAPVSSGIHAIHPYPAKFIPQIPRKLIELFHPHDSSLILDPFCGSGTALVEAIAIGLDAVCATEGAFVIFENPARFSSLHLSEIEDHLDSGNLYVASDIHRQLWEGEGRFAY